MKATLTSKGQITIPVDIRTRLHLKPGDVLEFDETSPFLKATKTISPEAWEEFGKEWTDPWPSMGSQTALNELRGEVELPPHPAPSMRTALDSSVVILLQRRERGWEAWRDRLSQAAAEGPLLISPVVFAECSAGFPSAETAVRAFESIQVYLDQISPDSAYLAGQTFLRYRREGGPRQHIVPDFLIAAHATLQADRLAAIDRGYLRRYFPALKLLGELEHGRRRGAMIVALCAAGTGPP